MPYFPKEFFTKTLIDTLNVSITEDNAQAIINLVYEDVRTYYD